MSVFTTVGSSDVAARLDQVRHTLARSGPLEAAQTGAELVRDLELSLDDLELRTGITMETHRELLKQREALTSHMKSVAEETADLFKRATIHGVDHLDARVVYGLYAAQFYDIAGEPAQARACRRQYQSDLKELSPVDRAETILRAARLDRHQLQLANPDRDHQRSATPELVRQQVFAADNLEALGSNCYETAPAAFAVSRGASGLTPIPNDGTIDTTAKVGVFDWAYGQKFVSGSLSQIVDRLCEASDSNGRIREAPGDAGGILLISRPDGTAHVAALRHDAGDVLYMESQSTDGELVNGKEHLTNEVKGTKYAFMLIPAPSKSWLDIDEGQRFLDYQKMLHNPGPAGNRRWHHTGPPSAIRDAVRKKIHDGWVDTPVRAALDKAKSALPAPGAGARGSALASRLNEARVRANRWGVTEQVHNVPGGPPVTHRSGKPARECIESMPDKSMVLLLGDDGSRRLAAKADGFYVSINVDDEQDVRLSSPADDQRFVAVDMNDPNFDRLAQVLANDLEPAGPRRERSHDRGAL